MIVRQLTARKATVELTWDDVQHLGIELHRSDAQEWWRLVWAPMIELREEEGLPLD